MRNIEKMFWMVLNPATGQTHVHHESKPEAIKEAQRLAKANPGQRFYVLEAQEFYAFRPEPVQRVQLFPSWYAENVENGPF